MCNGINDVVIIDPRLFVSVHDCRYCAKPVDCHIILFHFLHGVTIWPPQESNGIVVLSGDSNVVEHCFDIGNKPNLILMKQSEHTHKSIAQVPVAVCHSVTCC